MKVCSKCQKSNQDHDDHCLGCGGSLDAPSDEAPAAKARKELTGFERWMRHLAGIFGI